MTPGRFSIGSLPAPERGAEQRWRELAAAQAWEELRRSARQVRNDPRSAADASLTSRSWIYEAAAARRLNDLPGTILAWRRAIETAPDPQAAELSPAHGNLALALLDADLIDEALPHFEQALRLEPTVEGRRRVLANQASAFARLGELHTAARVRRRRVQELVQAGTRGEELGIAMDNEAYSLISLGEFDLAAELLNRAGEELQAAGGLARLVNAGALANLARARNRPAEAADAFGRLHALAFAWAEGRVRVERYVEGFARSRQASGASPEALQGWVAGIQARDLARFQQALQLWSQAAELARRAGDVALALRISANAAALLSDLGDVDQSAAILRQVSDEASTHALALPEAMAWATLATLAADGGDVGVTVPVVGMLALSDRLLKAQSAAVRAAGLSGPQAQVEAPDPGTVESTLARQARLHLALDLAREHYERALDVARAVNAPFELANRLGGLLDVCDLLGDVEGADSLARELAQVLTRADLPPRGRIVAERVLAEHVAASNPAQALEHLRAAVAELEGLRRRLPPGPGRAGAQAGSERTYRLLARLLREAGDAAGAFDALQLLKGRRLVDALRAATGADPDQPAATAAAVQAWIASGLLPAETVVVDLVAERPGIAGGPDHLAAHLVWAGGVAALEITGDLSALADVERGDAAERQLRLLAGCQRDPMLRDLAAGVEAAVAAALPGGASILLVPDGALHNLPLHAVPVAGRPWCDQRRIADLPAVGALPFLTAPRPAAALSLVAGDSSAGAPLPGAAAECRTVAALLDATALIGPQQCRRDTLVQALGRGDHDVVHLAVHGRGDPQNGGRASLLVGQDDWMPFDELARLPWRARLVVFSGCSTAVAGPRHQRDFLDVATAAAQAGAAAVIACLWPIDDDAARVFMTAFHAWWAPRRAGAVDLREGLDLGRRAVRAEQTARRTPGGGVLESLSAPVRRDGRAISAAAPSNEFAELGASLPADTLAALDWAPFILLGDPYAAHGSGRQAPA